MRKYAREADQFMDEFPRLTKREWDVLKLLLQGKSNKRIAWEMSVSKRTVEFHLKNIYTKFGVASRVELILKLGKTTGLTEVEKLGQSAVVSQEPMTENWGKFTRAFRWSKPIFGKEIEMKTLMSRTVSGAIVTALLTGLAWISALIHTQNLYLYEVKPWIRWLLLIWIVIGLTIGLMGKYYGNSFRRVVFSTIIAVGLSPLTIVPIILSILLPIGRIADKIGLIDAAQIPGSVATQLTTIVMIAIWLFVAIIIGVVLLFLTIRKPAKRIVPTQAEQTM
jgi:DNA-binding CsgD family transcriptional regulator